MISINFLLVVLVHLQRADLRSCGGQVGPVCSNRKYNFYDWYVIQRTPAVSSGINNLVKRVSACLLSPCTKSKRTFRWTMQVQIRQSGRSKFCYTLVAFTMIRVRAWVRTMATATFKATFFILRKSYPFQIKHQHRKRHLASQGNTMDRSAHNHHSHLSQQASVPWSGKTCCQDRHQPEATPVRHSRTPLGQMKPRRRMLVKGMGWMETTGALWCREAKVTSRIAAIKIEVDLCF
jgi:hypothetical protein